ncbi:hypothetical protein Tco_1394019 [Tanacetum coccineum]
MTSICDMVGQIMQKKEMKGIGNDHVDKDRYWKFPFAMMMTALYHCIHTVFINQGRPFKGISEETCDVPICEDPSTFDALSNHSEILSDSNMFGTSSDDDSYENIEYIEASPFNLEYDSLEEVNEDQEKDRLITNIESLKDNPTPDHVFKSPSSVPNPVTNGDSFFEESDTSLSHLDNSLPEFETFSDTTTHANNSLPEYDLFLFGLISFMGRTQELEEPMKDQPLSADASPTALSPGLSFATSSGEAEEDPEEDPGLSANEGDNF